ncbi:MAG: NAD(P)-binding protein [Myxococcota bacterium]|jgi:hypothetical protein
MSKILVVGAGLSGMTAGICLARDGHEVEIWDRGDAIGGVARDQEAQMKRPTAIADMTPFDIGRLSQYLGFDLTPDKEKSNNIDYFTPLPSARFYISGEKCEMHYQEDLHMKLVERGPRPSSLDSHLYQTALNAGVKFRYNMAVESREDFAGLPPGSIIATGMFRKSFAAFDLPHVPAYAYFAIQEFENYQGPETIVYLDKYTKDYGYFTYINGIGTAILFQRGAAISGEAQEWFRRQLKDNDGLDFTDWRTNQDFMATPTGSLFNPRLFHDRFILTGTLAGVQDPSWVIGVHGALVSGKIAAIAVTDRGKALKEFRRMNRWWWLCYLAKKFFNATHPYSLRYIYRPIISSRSRFHQRYLWFLYPAIPGLRRI